MGDFISAARLVGRFAISMVAMAGHGPHRTAVDNARVALAEAQLRAKERRDVDAALARIARASAPPFRTDGARIRSVAR